MAYIPPHKRLSQENVRPELSPELLEPRFHGGLNKTSPLSGADKSGEVVRRWLGNGCMWKWFAVGLDYDGHLPSHVHSELVKYHQDQELGETLISFRREAPILANRNHAEDNTAGTPWVTVAEQSLQDLQSCFETLKNEADNQGLEQIKPRLLVGFGKILFRQRNSAGTVVNGQLDLAKLRTQRRLFAFRLPSSYMKNRLGEVVPKIGLDFVEEREKYHVKLSDKTRPDVTILCKCRLTNDKSLMLYKVGIEPVKQMDIKVSCLEKDLDLSIMLYTKRILKDLSENELNSIRDLINSAVLDSNVKGGLRWALGKSSGDRFEVTCVHHETYKRFRNQSVLFKAGHSDWFSFEGGIGLAREGICFSLKGVASQLQEQGARSDAVLGLLKDDLKLIWDNFLCCEQVPEEDD